MVACLKVGWKNMWKITCFGFLILLACFTAFMISVVGVLAVIYSTTSSSFPDYLFLLFFVYFVVISIVRAAMIAGPSMVVVEGKSVVQAMKSSWHLCKTHICFIYCGCEYPRCHILLGPFSFAHIQSLLALKYWD